MARSMPGFSTELDPNRTLGDDGDDLLGRGDGEAIRPPTTGWATLQRFLGGTSSHQKSVRTPSSSPGNVEGKLGSVLLSSDVSPTQTLQSRARAWN
jgi:hypothetical protein